jgi:hypothetical protein
MRWEQAMSLEFVGIDPNTGEGESPTVWADHQRQELVLQGWKADAALHAECAALEVPGHAQGVPAHEAVIRIPARMIPVVREACDALERSHVG